MTDIIEVVVPDIGDFDAVDVIELLVGPGDRVSIEDPLVTLESDKATMEIPSPAEGEVAEMKVAVGDQVAQGAVILTLRTAGAAATPAADTSGGPDAASGPEPGEDTDAEAPAPAAAEPATAPAASDAPATGAVDNLEVRVPDIGDFDAVEVIEILVGVNDTVRAEDSIITLESDKATMEIPAPASGTVQAIAVRLGDMVSEGDLLMNLAAAGDTDDTARAPAGSAPVETQPAVLANEPAEAPAANGGGQAPGQAMSTTAYAGPSVRRFARELGVDLDRVSGSGRKGRILEEDVKGFVKQSLSTGGTGPAPAAGAALPTLKSDLDFSKYGATRTSPLSRIRRLSGQNLHASWVGIPHVTQFDEADITELEAFRKSQRESMAARDIKLTPVAFVIKACAAALGEFPEFNASLAGDGEQLILKEYCNIGFAVDTPDGLLVPVIRDVPAKGVADIAAEVQALSEKARNKRLGPADMQGGCFTITSLGGIGGTAFTPIINPPEVAILGLSRARMKPVWDGESFQPRLMLPLSLSYDHRVIDGVAGARFTSYLAAVLADLRLLVM